MQARDMINKSPIKQRLPVYILVDCSASMAGAPLEAMNEAIHQCCRLLEADATTRSSVWISIITFGTAAEQTVPLTPLEHFQLPPLSAGGASSLGMALRLLRLAADQEVNERDWQPIVFVLTDGEPTDLWEPQARNIKIDIGKKWANVVVFACGDHTQADTLYSLTDQVFSLSDITLSQLDTFFRWVPQDTQHATPAATQIDPLFQRVRSLL
ncbi:MAG: VWA domain-containing protein [Chloroflexota bacterium]